MGHRYAEIAFTDRVRERQEEAGSRRFYQKMEDGPHSNASLTDFEIDFIAERDSFYVASVGETGWPYVQHRGGPKGFLKTLGDGRLGYAEFRGNRQYVTVGNATGDNRVSLILMDYAGQRRLKIFGRMTVSHDPGHVSQLAVPSYPGRVERAVIIEVEAFDWNCPQHITPRFSEDEVAERIGPLQRRVQELEAQLQLMAA